MLPPPAFHDARQAVHTAQAVLDRDLASVPVSSSVTSAAWPSLSVPQLASPVPSAQQLSWEHDEKEHYKPFGSHQAAQGALNSHLLPESQQASHMYPRQTLESQLSAHSAFHDPQTLLQRRNTRLAAPVPILGGRPVAVVGASLLAAIQHAVQVHQLSAKDAAQQLMAFLLQNDDEQVHLPAPSPHYAESLSFNRISTPAAAANGIDNPTALSPFVGAGNYGQDLNGNGLQREQTPKRLGRRPLYARGVVEGGTGSKFI